MRLSKTLLTALTIAGLLAAVGCQKPEPTPPPAEQGPPPAPEPAPEPAPANTAQATFAAAADLAVSGTVTFTEVEGGVEVMAEVAGVERAGLHGLHLHETGDCSAGDFTSAGGHFDPTGVDHGGPDAEVHHAGDFGNIEIAEDGTGTLTLVSDMLSIDGEENGVVGRAVILHEGEDDMSSQPTGAAGARLACGVVEASGDDMMADDGDDAMADDADAMADDADAMDAGDDGMADDSEG